MSGNLHCRMALYYFLGPHIQSLGWNIPHSVWQAGRYDRGFLVPGPKSPISVVTYSTFVLPYPTFSTMHS